MKNKTGYLLMSKTKHWGKSNELNYIESG